jgi:hypothetical protein
MERWQTLITAIMQWLRWPTPLRLYSGGTAPIRASRDGAVHGVTWAREGSGRAAPCVREPVKRYFVSVLLVLQLLKVVIPLVGPAQNGRFVSAVLSRGNLFPI